MIQQSNYDKQPFVQVPGGDNACHVGFDQIEPRLRGALDGISGQRKVIALECYTGIYYDDLLDQFKSLFDEAEFIDTRSVLKSHDTIMAMTEQYITDDPVFGFMNSLEIEDFFDAEKVNTARNELKRKSGLIVIFGHGASVITNPDLIVYADMARWEIQMRMRRNEVNGLGVKDGGERIQKQYKRGYFVDWRVCDRLKRRIIDRIDFVLDTNDASLPKMVGKEIFLRGLRQAATTPHRVVPFFDPGPWGGQWMKEVCDLDRSEINFAWCFDCVPEENSLLLKFGDILFETPSINVVFFESDNLLGPNILNHFGAEFPIRFDFLDTMDGGNLSLQVHPTKQYIKEKFGMDYTQDESYYILDAGEGAHVYLGLRDGVDPDHMLKDLNDAQEGGDPFPAEKHVAKWPVQKHDHVLIPAGTVHCSGKDSMVLEISATPYIFTFKLWDWGRLGLDGRPRPIHIEHGEQVIQWDRTTSWTGKELINRFETVAESAQWKEEKTGLHELEFIETRRHWFTGKVPHDTNGTVNVLNLIEGREAIVESPEGTFEPFVVHYAETFIIPAAVGRYTIRPFGEGEGTRCGTIKAYVRDNIN